MKAWLLASRPKTLSAAVLPIILVTCYLQPPQWYYSIFAIFSALSIQIATNLFNDALDFRKGADTETRLGPKRATQSGWFQEKQVLRMGYLFCFFALIFAIPLIVKAGWILLAIGIISLIFAYLYTGGPYPLAYYGMGDLFVFIFFGLVATFGTYWIYEFRFSCDVLVLATQCGFLCTTLIAINNLRDVESDKLANKKTLAVFIGPKWVRFEILFLYLFTFIIQIYWLLNKESSVFLFVYILLLPCMYLVRNIFQTPPSKAYNDYLAKASMIYILFTIIQSIGFL